MRVLIERLRCFREERIHFRDLTRDRRVDIRDGLDRLDGADNIALRHRGADLWQVYIYDVAEFMLSMVRNADGSYAAVYGDPLVFLRITIIVWIHCYLARL